jgi:hypothetical protein
MSPLQYVSLRSTLFFFPLLLSTGVLAQAISNSRTTDWSFVGYDGDIPSYETIKNILDYNGHADGSGFNDVALEDAITSLNGENGTIYFPAGTYVFTAPINLRSGLILKGAGASNTSLKFNFPGTDNLISVVGDTTDIVSNVTSSVLKNDSSLVVEDATFFSVNDYVKVYQNDTALINDEWALESIAQIVRINAISNNNISFSHGLRRSYSAADSTRIRKLNVVSGTGIECLKITGMSTDAQQQSNIFFKNAANCWVKSIESDSCNLAHVQIVNSTNITVSNSFFHGAFSYGSGGEGYGVFCEQASGECLIENNIFKHLRHAMLLQAGANGNVFDYNYSILPFKSESLPNDFSGDIVLHGNYPYLNLFEGNIVQNIIIDASHGINGPYNTLFRNRAESYGIFISTNAGDSSNIVGNEITGIGFARGFYSIRGDGNFEFSNNKNYDIIPESDSTLGDSSFVYSSIPNFWNTGALWPPVGTPNSLGVGTIPAKERYLAGVDLTPCMLQALTRYTFIGNGNWNDVANWVNNKMPPDTLPPGSEIIIDPSEGDECVLNVAYKLNAASTLKVMPGKRFLIQGNLTLGL